MAWTMARASVTGNGSVVDAKSASAMAPTGVGAIMVGRAALANPGIFNQLRGEDFRRETKDDFKRHLDYLLRFRDQLAAHFPKDHIPSADGFASVKMHVHLFRYFNGRPGAAELRKRLNTVRTLAEIETVVRKVVN